jgi:hypothetical protein
MMTHGQEGVTEIVSTRGKLSADLNPQKNMVDIDYFVGITWK